MKTKLRLQIMIGLLFIAMTISVIAVSLAWYSADPGEITLEGSSVTVTTADDDYTINMEYEAVGVVTIDENSNYVVSALTPYLGQDGIEESYMILFEVSGSEALTTDSYVSKCVTSIEEKDGTSKEFTYTTENTIFQIIYVNYEDDICTESNSVTEYIIIVFGNGNDEFKFSDIHYMGTTFQLEINLGGVSNE